MAKNSKEYVIGPIKQLIDLNNDLLNFSVKFSVKTEGKFQIVVVDQTTLDNNSKIDWKDADNELSGNLISNKNKLNNFFLMLRSDDRKKCIVDIELTEVEPDLTPNTPNINKRNTPPRSSIMPDGNINPANNTRMAPPLPRPHSSCSHPGPTEESKEEYGNKIVEKKSMFDFSDCSWTQIAGYAAVVVAIVAVGWWSWTRFAPSYFKNDKSSIPVEISKPTVVSNKKSSTKEISTTLPNTTSQPPVVSKKTSTKIKESVLPVKTTIPDSASVSSKVSASSRRSSKSSKSISSKPQSDTRRADFLFFNSSNVV